MNDKSYRKNVGLIVLNQKNQLLVCKRVGKRTWQFPQGGIDEGESELKAAYRELHEEVGIKQNEVKVVHKSNHWYRYDLPIEYRKRTKSMRKFKGQTQKWYMFKATKDLTVNLLNEMPQEFIDYKWVEFWYPLSHIVAFKKDVYSDVLNEFLPKYIEVANG